MLSSVMASGEEDDDWEISNIIGENGVSSLSSVLKLLDYSPASNESMFSSLRESG